LAPYQVVLIPIYRKDEDKTAVLTTAHRIFQELTDAGVRVKMDDRENLTPGYKYNDWELRGVPLRLEIGPRDVENNSAALARRDIPGKEGKQFVPQEGLTDAVTTLLVDIQQNMLAKATRFRDENTHDVGNYEEFQTAVQTGFARVWWAGSDADETRVKEETKATIRCFPLDQPGGGGVCFYTGKPATRQAIFSRAY
jgi:prolyl-tRNA synthetase